MKTSCLLSVAGAVLISAAVMPTTPEHHSGAIAKRTLEPPGSKSVPPDARQECGIEGGLANRNDVWIALGRLAEKGNQKITAPQGHGQCARAECFRGADIALCNDDEHAPLSILRSEVYQYALNSATGCKGLPNGKSKGQTFEPRGKWNVIVKWTDDTESTPRKCLYH